MTYDALGQMINYVIEAWMIGSAAYLGISFAWSLARRIRADMAVQTSQKAAVKADSVAADRLTEVTAVTEKYGKVAAKESVQAKLSA